MNPSMRVAALCAELVEEAQKHGYQELTIQALLNRVWSDKEQGLHLPEGNPKNQVIVIN